MNSSITITLHGGPEDGTVVAVATMLDGTIPKDLYCQIIGDPLADQFGRTEYHYRQNPDNPTRYDYQGEETK